jgi:hypothetical protein
VERATQLCGGEGIPLTRYANPENPYANIPKRLLRQLKAELDASSRAYRYSICRLRDAVAFFVEKPTSRRRLDSLLRAQMREADARRSYEHARTALLGAVTRSQPEELTRNAE